MIEEIYTDEFLISKLKEHFKNEGYIRNNLSEDNTVMLWGLKLVYYNYPLPNSIVKTSWLSFDNYNYSLPNSITETGILFLNSYEHPLPNSIIGCGDIFAQGYKHKLPESIFNDENIKKGFTIII